MRVCRIRTVDGTSYAVEKENAFEEIKGLPYSGMELTGKEYPKRDAELLAPCEPSKIVAVGLNYRQHANELNMEIPKEPLTFLKPSTSVIGQGDKIVIPKMSKRVDYEAELGVVIGKECKSIEVENVLDYIFGFTCLNDVTARDIQKRESQWTRAKGFDTFCPIGPAIETEYAWRSKRVRAILNGETAQDSSTDDLIFSVEEIISFISQVMTLYPGDVIATGTPSGIGPMKSGDEIKIILEGIGTLKNTVI